MSYHGGNPTAPRGTRGHFVVGPRGSASNASHYIGAIPHLVAPVLGGLAGSLAFPTSLSTINLRKAAFVSNAAQNVALARASAVTLRLPSVTKPTADAKGRIVVPISSFWSNLNQTAAQAVKPFAGAVNAMTFLTVAQRNQIINAPLDALLDMFDPIFDHVGAAVDRVLAKKGNVQNYFGSNKNLQRVQANDLKSDAVTQDLLKKLRTIEAFVVLFFTQPIDLAGEMLKEGLDIAQSAGQVVGQVATNVASAIGKDATEVMQASTNAASTVASWFGLGHFSYALGDGGLVSGPTAATAATGVTATAGAGVEGGVSATITAILDWITANSGLLATIVGTGGGVLTAAVASGGVLNPTKSPSKSALPQPAGARGASVQSTLPAPLQLPPSSSGSIPPIAIFGGAALLAFFLLSRK